MSYLPHYRKKPIVVEAFQITKAMAEAALMDDGPLPYPELHAYGNWNAHTREVHDVWIGVNTLEGHMKARVNDWIIKGVKGELYPCKPDIFAETYEVAP